jgi:O-antigen ligase
LSAQLVLHFPSPQKNPHLCRMLEFLRRNAWLLAIFVLWYAVGSRSVAAFYALGSLTVLLWWRRKMYFEILLGFFFILILSDNLRYTTDFAKVFKNIYMLLLPAIVLLSRKDFQPFNRLYLHFFPFVLIALVGLAFSPIPFTGIQKTVSYGLLFFAVPQFLTLAFRNRGPLVIKDLIFLGVFMIGIGLVMVVVDPNIALSHGGRLRGVFGNPNGLGIFSILLLVLVVLGREYFKDFFSKNELRWMAGAIALAVLLSGSRTSIMAAFLFLLFVRFFRTSPFLGFIIFFAFGIGVEVVSSNIVSIVQGLGLSDFLRIDTLEEGSGRYVAWSFAWENIQDHFWFGRGFAFDEWLMGENQDFLNALGHQGGVHNTYLIIWLNTGLVGLLIFLRAFFLGFMQAGKYTAIAYPAMFLVLFSIALEPWLAASLNPFTILLISSIVLMTDASFQPYLYGKIKPDEKPQDDAPALA